jgi:hypothetical protein
MNRLLILLTLVIILSACNTGRNVSKRIAVAQVGKFILYYDEMPKLVQPGLNKTDSIALIQEYINKWAKRKLLLMKAEENLSPELKHELIQQIEETRSNLIIYQYQKQMILEKLDTVLTEAELESYYSENEKSFTLSSNIVKVLFVKLPLETPDPEKVKRLVRSNDQEDLQELESYCYQFAEKYEDYNEAWIPMDRISVELRTDIENEENFLKRNTYFETADSLSIYLISIRDYRLRSSIAPFDYVRDDIKRIIWNTRRLEFLQSLENGIYSEGLKENSFKIY